MNTVSVIIPLFNKRLYFEACLNALLNQTVKPSEIIVVDDGSTDGSLDFAHEQAARFENEPIAYRVIEREHLGVSAALNVGLDNATSTYVTRVDADDLVASRWLETLLNQDIAHKPVNLRCLHTRVPEHADFASVARLVNEQSAEDDSFSALEISSGNVLYGRLFAEIDTNLMSSCGMLYVREELLRFDMRFCENLSHTEDLLFNATLFAHNTPSIIINEPLYFYRQVPESLSKAPDSLFPSIALLEKKLDDLALHASTATVAKAHRSEVLHYLCWYYSIALLDEEKNRSKDPDYRERVEQAQAHSNIDDVFERANEAGVTPALAGRLYSLLKNKQYAQLQLAARTINVARTIRRTFKTNS